MTLDVPYFSQIDLEETEIKIFCGIASLAMVLRFYLKDQAPDAKSLIQKYGEEFSNSGFTHKEILKIARDFNLRGFRKSWWAEPGVQNLLETFRNEGESEEDINDWLSLNNFEARESLKKLVNQDIPVIVSVSPEFSPSQETHLVVIIGVEEDSFIIHDPYKRGQSFKISFEEFEKYFLRQAIIIKK